MNSFREFITIIPYVLTRPSTAAQKLKNKNYLLWILFLFLLWQILNLFASTEVSIILNQQSSNLLTFLFNLALAFLIFPISVNFIAKILGGNGKYVDAIQIYIIFNIPFILFSLVLLLFTLIQVNWPNNNINLSQLIIWLQVVVTIWVIVLQSIGIKISYQISYWRAVISMVSFYLLVFLSLIIYAVLVGILSVL